MCGQSRPATCARSARSPDGSPDAVMWRPSRELPCARSEVVPSVSCVWCGDPRISCQCSAARTSAVNRACAVSWRHFGPTTGARARGKKRKKLSPLHVSKHKTLRVALSKHRDSRCGTGVWDLMTRLGHCALQPSVFRAPHSSTLPGLQFTMGPSQAD